MWGIGRAGLIALVILLLVATAVMAANESRRIAQDHERDSAMAVSNAVAELEALDGMIDAVGAARGLVRSDDQMDQRSFEAFASVVSSRSVISSVSFHPRVGHEERDTWEVDHGAAIHDRGPDGSISPSPVRDEHHPSVWSTPPEAFDTIGLDAAGVPGWSEALNTAADLDQPVGSGPLAISGVTDRSMVVVVPLPSFTNDSPPAGLMGHIAVVIDMDQLAIDLSGRLPSPATLQVWDESDAVVHLGQASSDPVEAEVTVAGRRWVVHGPSASISPWSASVLAIIAVGTLLSIVVGGGGAHRLAQHRRLDEARSRLARLQNATAELARTRFPDAVWSVTVKNVAQILRVPSAVAIVDSGGELTVAASTDDALATRLDGLERSTDQALGEQILSGLGPGTESWWCLDLLNLPPPIDGAVLVAARDRQCREEDRSVCESFLEVAAAALRRARYHELEHRMADSLREQILEPFSSSTRVDLDVTYQPHDRDAGIGGDWYDLVELDENVVVVNVGDVVGHGIAAAGASGQLRTAMRALAPFTSPAQCLQSLGRLSRSIPNAELSTALSIRLDLAAMTATYSVAGHPPPLLVRDGRVEQLLGARGVPLGLETEAPRVNDSFALREDDHLVLYTDGAIERRDRSWDEGVDLLAQIVLQHLERESHLLRDDLHTRLFDGAADDATVLVLSIHGRQNADV